MSARESTIASAEIPGLGLMPGFSMTLLGPAGLRKRLLDSFSFMGRMRCLRPLEFTVDDCRMDQSKWGLKRYQKADQSPVNFDAKDELG